MRLYGRHTSAQTESVSILAIFLLMSDVNNHIQPLPTIYDIFIQS